MDSKTIVRFERFLSDCMGLDADSVGRDRLLDVLKRMSARRGVSETVFLDELLINDALSNEVFDAIAVPETWFMRGGEAMETFADYVMQTWWPSHREGREKVRVLSIPCASGEEPYSLGMMLALRGFPLERLFVKGVDISGAVLEHAKQGMFRAYSFRGTNADELLSHFFDEEIDGAWQIGERVRGVVHFEQGNITDEHFLSGDALYDVVFCRNLLIYLNGHSRTRAAGHLVRLLKTDGMLFVGPSESSCIRGDFESVGRIKSFAFRRRQKVQAGRGEIRRSKPERALREKIVMASPDRTGVPLPAELVQPVAEKADSQSVPEVTLAEIRRLADGGAMTDARRMLLEFLDQQPMDTDALCLMGVLHGACGDVTEAENCFRKALYTDPQHEESISHMILLLNETGRPGQAAVLRHRLEGGRKVRPE